MSWPREFRPYCILPAGEVLGVLYTPGTGKPKLAVARNEAVVELAQPPMPLGSELNCDARIGGPPVRCGEFRERVFNHTVSPDGSVVAAVTGSTGAVGFDADVMGPDYKTTRHVLSASKCEVLRTFEPVFPERVRVKAPLLAPKNKYWENARLFRVFAQALAISPDNTKLAIGYGVRTDGTYSDAIAYFGLYSLQDGRRLATLRGDVFKNGWLETIRMMDAVPTTWAPVTGLIFSSDSKSLFCSSRQIRQWDLSSLP